jgi:kumamolisin
MDKYLPLRGSTRKPARGARRIAAANLEEVIAITLVLRRRVAIETHWRHCVSRLERESFKDRHGAAEPDIALVREFAAQNHLTVKTVHRASRTIELSGRIADLSSGFRTNLSIYHGPQGNYRGRNGPLHIPEHLDGIVVAVLGLDNRPQVKPHFVRPFSDPGANAFTPREVAALYDFPLEFDGSGQRIGILEFGGGYDEGDLITYFSNLGLTMPSVASFSVDGGTNSPGADADVEVMLDIEIAGCVALGAGIKVYFAPNTDAGYLDAISGAVHDEGFRPTVISVSWGGPENIWTDQTKDAIEGALWDAAALGVTVCFASGDSGSSDGEDGANVDFPAACPHALGCGGTRLNSTIPGTTDSENVWNDDSQSSASGGGVSAFFPLPPYQFDAGVPSSVNGQDQFGRGVPDVAGDADPETGYRIRAQGSDQVVGGTSCVAPLWAGLVALINRYLAGPTAGFLNPMLYTDISTRADFRDITFGDNGAYSAGPGWDACTGWGSPDGTRVLNSVGTWYFTQTQINFL